MSLNVAERYLPIKTAYMGVACANCMNSSGPLVQCACCKKVKYCNKSCQMSDWKTHKHECKLIKLFKEEYNILPGFSLMHKVTSMRQMVEQMVLEEEIPTSLNQPRLVLFLQYSRVCAVCHENEYELDANTKWINCPICKFAWCCSQKHFDECPHSPELCLSFVKSIEVSRFRWQHAKNYDEPFVFLPPMPRTEPMESFPESWNDFFRIRCSDMFQYAQEGHLPAEFFPASTHELSQAATCLYAMYQHGLDKNMKELTIHVVGASFRYECPPSSVWEEIMHCLPPVMALNLVFVGPEACNFMPPMDKLEVKEIECCPSCVSQNRSCSAFFCRWTYHDYKASSDFTRPDLIVAFNTGMHEECVESWATSLQVILDMNVPAMFTSYNEDEAVQDYEILRSANARLLTSGPVLNPMREDHSEFEAGAGAVDRFFSNNMYCVGFKGRV